MRDIGKNIKEFRILKNMTQDELAEKLYVTRQTVSNYETGKSRPDVTMLVKIGEVLDTDIQQLIYGLEQKRRKPELKRLMVWAALTAVLALTWFICEPLAMDWKSKTFCIFPVLILRGVVKPLLLLSMGWLLGHLLVMALGWRPPQGRWVGVLRRVMLIVIVLFLMVSVLYVAYYTLDELLYMSKLRGTWEEIDNGTAWRHLPLPGLNWLSRYLFPVVLFHEGIAVVIPVLYTMALRFLEPPSYEKKNM